MVDLVIRVPAGTLFWCLGGRGRGPPSHALRCVGHWLLYYILQVVLRNFYVDFCIIIW